MAKKSGQKLNLKLLVLCDYSIVSKENKLSILGIFDQIFINNTPAQHSRLFVVGVVKGNPNSRHKISLSIKDPADVEIFPKQEIFVNLGTNGKSNIIFELGNLPLPKTGTYLIEILTPEGLLGKEEFMVYKTGDLNGDIEQGRKFAN